MKKEKRSERCMPPQSFETSILKLLTLNATGAALHGIPHKG